MTTLDLILSASAAETVTPSRPSRYLAVKAVADRCAAALLLLALALPMLAIAAAVRLSSQGPAIYRQVRYGKDGTPFRMWKFRTMVEGADLLPAPPNDADGLLYKARQDPRITGFGRFLRRWSLDELPQLVNVLTGEMSLVGPRPLPVDVGHYCNRAWRRLSVRPGITGLWQVSGRSDLGWEQCLELDLAYVDGLSIGLDVRVLARTARAVVRRAGAY